VIAVAIARTKFLMSDFRKLPMLPTHVLRASRPVRYVAEVRALLIAMTAALALAACGSAGTGSGTESSPSSGLGFNLAISEKDKSAAMKVGQKLEVVLHAPTGMAAWTQPKSSNEAILVPIVNPAATAARGVTLAAFKALAPGEVQITSNDSPNCSPGQACPQFIAVYSVTVTVTP
jgi:hypothetical protein